jgi:hypothetical protein
MRDLASPVADDPDGIVVESQPARPRPAPPLPPEWTRKDPVPASPGPRTATPIVIAAIGWIVAAALLIYSHGQADRVRTTQEDMRSRVAALTHDLTLARTVQNYLSTPNLKVLTFRPLRPVPANSLVNLIMSPNYLHVVVVARWLGPLQPNQAYAVWARGTRGTYELLGTLVQKGPAGDYAAVVVGQHPISTYHDLYVSLEYGQQGRKPAGPLLFGARIVH